MINSIEYAPEIITDYKAVNVQKQIKPAKNTGVSSVNRDTYVSDNPAKNLKQGLECGDVEYIEPTTILWGAVTLRDAYYTYTCNGHERIGDIKKKFGIPDHAIFRLNKIKDDDYQPEAGKKIAFDYKCE